MSHQIHVSPSLTKEEKYKNILPQLNALVEGEGDMIANMANISSALRQAFEFFWIGFYIVKSQELVLGPFQGTIACTRIKYGKGVCGTAWKEKDTIIVPNVNLFPGHIACDAASQSEIVVPLFKDDEVFAVLDVDSDQLNHFDDIDSKYLRQVVGLLEVRI